MMSSPCRHLRAQAPVVCRVITPTALRNGLSEGYKLFKINIAILYVIFVVACGVMNGVFAYQSATVRNGRYPSPAYIRYYRVLGVNLNSAPPADQFKNVYNVRFLVDSNNPPALLTPCGAPTPTSSACFSFNNGADRNYLDVLFPSSLPIDDFTIAMWINRRSTSGTYSLFFAGDASNTFIELTANSATATLSYDGSVVYTSSFAIGQNTWGHVAFSVVRSFDSSSQGLGWGSLYSNGALYAYASWTSKPRKALSEPRWTKSLTSGVAPGQANLEDIFLFTRRLTYFEAQSLGSSFYTCFGVRSDQVGVCSNNGACTAPDTCTCNTGWDGLLCELPLCFGNSTAQYNSIVCNDNGVCTGPNYCTCDSSRFVGSRCSNSICFGIDSSRSDVCSGHGTCTKPNYFGSKKYSNWFVDAFPKRKRLTIYNNLSNGLVLRAGHTVALTPFDTTAWSSSGCSALRLYYYDSSIDDMVELHRWIDSCGSASATLRFLLQADVTTSTTNYFLYYGASQVAPVLYDRAQVYLLWDDFASSGLRYWDTWLDGSILISGGVMNLQSTSTDAANNLRGAWTPLSYKVDVFQAEATLVVSTSGALLSASSFGGIAIVNDAFQGYAIEIVITSAILGITGTYKLNLMKCSGNGFSCTQIATANFLDLLPSYKVRLVLRRSDGGNILYQATDDKGNTIGGPIVDNSFTGPFSMMAIFGQSPGTVDDVLVRKFVPNEPSVVVGGEEQPPSNYCVCQDGYFGPSCNITTCYGILSNDSTVCSGVGSCFAYDYCLCSSSKFAGNECYLRTCNGLSPTDPKVCSGNGTCLNTAVCQCNFGYAGNNCEYVGCRGYPYFDPTGCSNRGTCNQQKPETCTCQSGWFGYCDVTSCGGIFSNDTSVCSGAGSCTAPETCVCAGGVVGSNCEFDARKQYPTSIVYPSTYAFASMVNDTGYLWIDISADIPSAYSSSVFCSNPVLGNVAIDSFSKISPSYTRIRCPLTYSYYLIKTPISITFLFGSYRQISSTSVLWSFVNRVSYGLVSGQSLVAGQVGYYLDVLVQIYQSLDPYVYRNTRCSFNGTVLSTSFLSSSYLLCSVSSTTVGTGSISLVFIGDNLQANLTQIGNPQVNVYLYDTGAIEFSPQSSNLGYADGTSTIQSLFRVTKALPSALQNLVYVESNGNFYIPSLVNGTWYYASVGPVSGATAIRSIRAFLNPVLGSSDTSKFVLISTNYLPLIFLQRFSIKNSDIAPRSTRVNLAVDVSLPVQSGTTVALDGLVQYKCRYNSLEFLAKATGIGYVCSNFTAGAEMASALSVIAISTALPNVQAPVSIAPSDQLYVIAPRSLVDIGPAVSLDNTFSTKQITIMLSPSLPGLADSLKCKAAYRNSSAQWVRISDASYSASPNPSVTCLIENPRGGSTQVIDINLMIAAGGGYQYDVSNGIPFVIFNGDVLPTNMLPSVFGAMEFNQGFWLSMTMPPSDVLGALSLQASAVQAPAQSVTLSCNSTNPGQNPFCIPQYGSSIPTLTLPAAISFTFTLARMGSSFAAQHVNVQRFLLRPENVTRSSPFLWHVNDESVLTKSFEIPKPLYPSFVYSCEVTRFSSTGLVAQVSVFSARLTSSKDGTKGYASCDIPAIVLGIRKEHNVSVDIIVNSNDSNLSFINGKRLLDRPFLSEFVDAKLQPRYKCSTSTSTHTITRSDLVSPYTAPISDWNAQGVTLAAYAFSAAAKPDTLQNTGQLVFPVTSFAAENPRISMQNLTLSYNGYTILASMPFEMLVYGRSRVVAVPSAVLRSSSAIIQLYFLDSILGIDFYTISPFAVNFGCKEDTGSGLLWPASATSDQALSCTVNAMAPALISVDTLYFTPVLKASSDLIRDPGFSSGELFLSDNVATVYVLDTGVLTLANGNYNRFAYCDYYLSLDLVLDVNIPSSNVSSLLYCRVEFGPGQFVTVPVASITSSFDGLTHQIVCNVTVPCNLYGMANISIWYGSYFSLTNNTGGVYASSVYSSSILSFVPTIFPFAETRNISVQTDFNSYVLDNFAEYTCAISIAGEGMFVSAVSLGNGYFQCANVNGSTIGTMLVDVYISVFETSLKLTSASAYIRVLDLPFLEPSYGLISGGYKLMLRKYSGPNMSLRLQGTNIYFPCTNSADGVSCISASASSSYAFRNFDLVLPNDYILALQWTYYDTRNIVSVFPSVISSSVTSYALEARLDTMVNLTAADSLALLVGDHSFDRSVSTTYFNDDSKTRPYFTGLYPEQKGSWHMYLFYSSPALVTPYGASVPLLAYLSPTISFLYQTDLDAIQSASSSNLAFNRASMNLTLSLLNPNLDLSVVDRSKLVCVSGAFAVQASVPVSGTNVSCTLSNNICGGNACLSSIQLVYRDDTTVQGGDLVLGTTPISIGFAPYFNISAIFPFESISMNMYNVLLATDADASAQAFLSSLVQSGLGQVACRMIISGKYSYSTAAVEGSNISCNITRELSDCPVRCSKDISVVARLRAAPGKSASSWLVLSTSPVQLNFTSQAALLYTIPSVSVMGYQSANFSVNLKWNNDFGSDRSLFCSYSDAWDGSVPRYATAVLGSGTSSQITCQLQLGESSESISYIPISVVRFTSASNFHVLSSSNITLVAIRQTISPNSSVATYTDGHDLVSVSLSMPVDFSKLPSGLTLSVVDADSQAVVIDCSFYGYGDLRYPLCLFGKDEPIPNPYLKRFGILAYNSASGYYTIIPVVGSLAYFKPVDTQIIVPFFTASNYPTTIFVQIAPSQTIHLDSNTKFGYACQIVYADLSTEFFPAVFDGARFACLVTGKISGTAELSIVILDSRMYFTSFALYLQLLDRLSDDIVYASALGGTVVTLKLPDAPSGISYDYGLYIDSVRLQYCTFDDSYSLLSCQIPSINLHGYKLAEVSTSVLTDGVTAFTLDDWITLYAEPTITSVLPSSLKADSYPYNAELTFVGFGFFQSPSISVRYVDSARGQVSLLSCRFIDNSKISCPAPPQSIFFADTYAPTTIGVSISMNGMSTNFVPCVAASLTIYASQFVQLQSIVPSTLNISSPTYVTIYENGFVNATQALVRLRSEVLDVTVPATRQGSVIIMNSPVESIWPLAASVFPITLEVSVSYNSGVDWHIVPQSVDILGLGGFAMVPNTLLAGVSSHQVTLKNFAALARSNGSSAKIAKLAFSDSSQSLIFNCDLANSTCNATSFAWPSYPGYLELRTIQVTFSDGSSFMVNALSIQEQLVVIEKPSLLDADVKLLVDSSMLPFSVTGSGFNCTSLTVIARFSPTSASYPSVQAPCTIVNTTLLSVPKPDFTAVGLVAGSYAYVRVEFSFDGGSTFLPLPRQIGLVGIPFISSFQSENTILYPRTVSTQYRTRITLYGSWLNVPQSMFFRFSSSDSGIYGLFSAYQLNATVLDSSRTVIDHPTLAQLVQNGERLSALSLPLRLTLSVSNNYGNDYTSSDITYTDEFRRPFVSQIEPSAVPFGSSRFVLVSGQNTDEHIANCTFYSADRSVILSTSPAILAPNGDQVYCFLPALSRAEVSLPGFPNYILLQLTNDLGEQSIFDSSRGSVQFFEPPVTISFSPDYSPTHAVGKMVYIRIYNPDMAFPAYVKMGEVITPNACLVLYDSDTQMVYYECQIGAQEAGTVKVSFSYNKLDWFPVPGTFKFFPCSAGWTASSFAAECVPCAAGTFKVSEGIYQCSSCDNNTYSDTLGSVSCKSCPDGSSTYGEGASSLYGCQCAPGSMVGFTNSIYARNISTWCIDCPEGANCTMPNTTISSIQADRSYWFSKFDWNKTLEDPARSALVFYKCFPKDACPGGLPDNCDQKYIGDRCGYCKIGYYKSRGECTACTGDAIIRLLILLAVLAALTVGFFLFSSVNVSHISSLSIGTAYFQVISIFSSFDINLPIPVQDSFSTASIINFNIDFVQPQCLIPYLPYFAKWIATLALPIAVFVLFVLFYVGTELRSLLAHCIGKRILARVKYSSLLVHAKLEDINPYMSRKAKIRVRIVNFFRRLVRDTKIFVLYIRNMILWFFKADLTRAQQRVILNKCVNSYLTFLSFAFIFMMTRSSLIFRCDAYSDGSYTFLDSPDIKCYSSTEWFAMLPFSIFFFLVLGVGAVILFTYLAFTSYRNKDNKDYNERYKFLLKKFRRRYFYWEGIIVLRKASLSILYVFLQPMLTVVFSIMIVFVAMCLHMATAPYKKKFHNIIELICLESTLISLFLGLLFFVDMWPADWVKTVATVVSLVVVITTSVVVVMCILYDIYVRRKKDKKKHKKYLKTALKTAELAQGYRQRARANTREREAAEFVSAVQSFKSQETGVPVGGAVSTVVSSSPGSPGTYVLAALGGSAPKLVVNLAKYSKIVDDEVQFMPPFVEYEALSDEEAGGV